MTRHRNDLMPDDRFVIAMQTILSDVSDIKSIKKAYGQLIGVIMMNTSVPHSKIPELLIKVITDSLPRKISPSLREHILNKG